jgi:hypothetical protein
MGAPSTGAPAQRVPGRGEGERESPALESDELPDGSIDGSLDGTAGPAEGAVPETSEEERNRAGSNDVAPVEPIDPIDPTRDPAIIDESGSSGFGGSVMSPESLGDGELRPDDDGEIEPDELPMLPADVVDAGPAMIP